MTHHEQPEGYDGEATVEAEGMEPRTAHVALGARFDPLVGHVVWSGRVAVALPPRTNLIISTPYGSGAAEAVEHDPWGNTRIRGSGRPPFPVELLDVAEPPAR